MQSRRPSGPPSDRLALLLGERAGASSGAGHSHGGGPGRPDDGGGLEPDDGGWGMSDPDDDGVRRGRHRRTGVPFLSVPASLTSVELAVGARAVRGLLVLAVVTALVLGGRWLWSQRPAEASAGDRVVSSDAGGVPSDEKQALQEEASGAPVVPESDEAVQEGGAEQGAPATQSAGPDVVVHVTGQVVEPGVVELPAGSRVVDAVRAAGGLTDEADRSSLNLARALVDGEQVWVGRPGDEPPAGWSPPATAGGAGAGTAEGAGRPPLDLNAAGQADLEELPGVGPVTAGHILAWRDEHGRFSRVDELLEVSGIGERTLAQLQPLVTVDG